MGTSSLSLAWSLRNSVILDYDYDLEERDNQLLSLTSGYKRFLLPFSGNTSINLRFLFPSAVPFPIVFRVAQTGFMFHRRWHNSWFSGHRSSTSPQVIIFHLLALQSMFQLPFHVQPSVFSSQEIIIQPIIESSNHLLVPEVNVLVFQILFLSTLYV
jgi:hypothetical protein